MDDEWDADNFDPDDIKTAPSVGANKWEGEDEDEDVKDNWEDEEEEEKKDVEKQEPAKPAQPKKSKKIIEEKEQRLHEEAETKGQEKETEQELTPEEIQKLQEEADLRVAMETFGVSEVLGVAEVIGVAETSTALGIEAMNPSNREEFDELQAAISKKVQSCAKSPHFPAFAEELIRNICVNLTSHDLKKLKTTVENMFIEKSKAEKGDKTKKSKGKGKVKLKFEDDHVLVNEYSYGDYDDYDDFM